MRRRSRIILSLITAAALTAAPLAGTAAIADELATDSTTAAADTAAADQAAADQAAADQAAAEQAAADQAAADQAAADQAAAASASATTADETAGGDVSEAAGSSARVAALAAEEPEEYQGPPAAASNYRITQLGPIEDGNRTITFSWESTPSPADARFTVYVFAVNYEQEFDYSRSGYWYDLAANSVTITLPATSGYDVFVHGSSATYGESYNGNWGGYWQHAYITGYDLVSAPSAPTDLAVARSATSDALAVSWAAPADDGNEAPSAYTVAWEDEAGSGDDITVDGSTTSTDLALPVGHDYTVTVSAQNSAGVGPLATSDPTALRALRPQAPASATAVQSDDEQITVSWTAPAYDGGADVTAYAVTLTDGTRTLTATQDAEFSSVDFALGYHPNTSWTATVSAITSAGTGSATTSNTVHVAADVPAQPVATATVLGYHSPSIRLDWTAAFDGGSPITGYIVVAVADGAQFADEIELPADARSYTFEGLTSSTSYNLFVVAVNAKGMSEVDGPSVTIATFAAAPSAPVVVPVPNGAITVQIVDGVAVATVSGQPGQWLYAYAYSTPTALGWAQVGADGTARWSLAGANLPNGAHHLVVIDDGGAVLGSAAFQLGTTGVTTAAAGSLVTTGADANGALLAALALLLVGGALVARRRVGARA